MLWLPRGLRLDAFNDLYLLSVFDIGTPEVSFVRQALGRLPWGFPVSYEEM